MQRVAGTVPAHFARIVERFGDDPVLFERKREVTRQQLLDDAAAAAAGLRAAGVSPGDRVGLYADNSARWIVTDLAIQLAGGVSVPRGTDTPAAEMAPLFAHAGVAFVMAHAQKQVDQIEARRDEIPTLGEVFAIDPRGASVRTLDDLIADGRDGPSFAEAAAAVQPDDLATIIYTSGTTGRPKGVMLTQKNFAHQIETVPTILTIRQEERFLSILPPWHIFERTVEFVALCSGCELVYTDRRRFRDDLATYKPTFLPSVPRIWETVYDTVQKRLKKASPVQRALFRSALATSGTRAAMWDRARGVVIQRRRPAAIKEALTRAGAGLIAALLWLPDRLAQKVVFQKLRAVTGGRMRGAISGGGLMPLHIDKFFHTIGVPILVGYGLTETSPVVAIRRIEHNVLGTIGRAVPQVDIQIRHPETGAVLPQGERGIVFTRGPNLMRGYYRDEALTAKVIDSDGWFDTGDLGWLTVQGDLCFAGRAKETIVLFGGENVEPSTVEEAIVASPLIEQVIVVGQDQKGLAALLVPDRAGVSAALGIDLDLAGMATDAAVRDGLKAECRKRTAALRSYERVTRVALLPEVLDSENGCLTQTLKPRRHVIVERFADKIEEAYG